MKDIDRVKILDGLLFENVFHKVEISGLLETKFSRGEYNYIPPTPTPGTDRVNVKSRCVCDTEIQSNSKSDILGTELSTECK